MKRTKRDKFLAAAFDVLSRAGRSMHYTQIVSVATKSGMLLTENKDVQASMVSFLGMDVRTNPGSRFVRDRPGVYALALSNALGRPQHVHSDQDSQTRIHHLLLRTSLPDSVAVLNKSFYLLGRLLDHGSESGVCSIRNLDGTNQMEVQLLNLVEEFDAEPEHSALFANSETTWRIKRKADQLARRLSLENPQFVVAIALFVLDLALDMVGDESLLVIGSGSSTTRLSLKSSR